MKVAIIINPRAGKIKKGKFKISKLEKIVGKENIKYMDDNISDILNEFADKGINAIGIVGGDGTYHRFLNYFIEFKRYNNYTPYLILLKGGTQNMVANIIGYKNPYKTVKKIIDGDYRIYEICPLEIKIENTKENKKYGFNFSGLAVAEFIEAYNDENVKVFGIKEASVSKAFFLLLKYIYLGIIKNEDEFYKKIIKPMKLAVYVEKENKKIDLTSIYNAFTVTSLPIKIIGLRVFKEVEGIAFAGGLIRGKEIIENAIVPRIWLGKKLKGILVEEGNKVEIFPYGFMRYAIDGDCYAVDRKKIIIKNSEKLSLLK